MLTEEEIICIFESDLPIKELSKQYEVKSDLIVSIQIGLYRTKLTENLISGRVKRFNNRPNKAFKLELEEVKFIIGSTHSYGQLAELFDVSKDTIFDIKKGKTWTNVDRSNFKASIRPVYYGEQCSSNKLTNDKVIEIISLLETQSNRALAKKFCVSVGTISGIRRNKTWTQIPRTYIYTNRKFKSGINHYNSKVTTSMLNEIMRSNSTLKVLAEKFNLAQSTICRIRQKYSKRNTQCYNSLSNANNW